MSELPPVIPKDGVLVTEETLAEALAAERGIEPGDVVETTTATVSALDYPDEWYDTPRHLAASILAYISKGPDGAAAAKLDDPRYIIELVALTDDPPRTWLALIHDDNDPSLHVDVAGDSIADVLRLAADQLVDREKAADEALG